KRCRARVEPRHAVECADPEVPISLDDPLDNPARQPFAVGVVRESAERAIEAVEPRARADPERLSRILEHGRNVVAADAVGIVGVGAVRRPRACPRVEVVQPTAVRAYPHGSILSGNYTANEVTAQTLRRLGVTGIGGDGSARRVEAPEPAAEGPDP